MSQMRRRQPKYRHVVPAVALMTTVVIAMAGITVARLSRIPAENPWVGVRHPEAASDVVARQAAARDAVARAAAVTAATVRPVSTVATPSASVAEPAPVKVIEAESQTLPLSPGTLMVGLASARSRTLASASPRPARPAECNGPVAENFDADIVGMTGVPGRKVYYSRKHKDSLAAACRRSVQAASATP